MRHTLLILILLTAAVTGGAHLERRFPTCVTGGAGFQPAAHHAAAAYPTTDAAAWKAASPSYAGWKPALQATAQSTTRPWGTGETLSYKLYFNWKFVWLTAGEATLTTAPSTYGGRKTWRCTLVTHTSQKIDRYFRMRDTLLCHVSQNLLPLYYRKAAAEGSRYYVDELLYKYQGGKVVVTQREVTSHGERLERVQTCSKNVYDMLAVFLRGRTYQPKGWKKGYTIIFPLADGKSVQNARLRFQGRSTQKAESGKRYRCLELSYIETDQGREKEICRFFVSDDSRHIPIRIDLFLRFGTAKAFLRQ